MSFKLVQKVIHSDRVEGMHKLVLIILADYVNESKGNAAWPSITSIALRAGSSVRHTRRLIRELENDGVLVTIRQAGLRGANKYRISVDNLVENGVENSQGADTHVLPRADIYDTRGGHMKHLGADTHVLRTDKEQNRTNKVGDAAASGRAAVASQQSDQTQTSDAVATPFGGDAPKCTQHAETDYQCETCYTWQQQEWQRNPLT